MKCGKCNKQTRCKSVLRYIEGIEVQVCQKCSDEITKIHKNKSSPNGIKKGKSCRMYEVWEKKLIKEHGNFQTAIDYMSEKEIKRIDKKN